MEGRFRIFDEIVMFILFINAYSYPDLIIKLARFGSDSFMFLLACIFFESIS